MGRSVDMEEQLLPGLWFDVCLPHKMLLPLGLLSTLLLERPACPGEMKMQLGKLGE